MSKAKQVVTSKRIWATTLLNTAWLLPHLDSMQLMKDKIIRLLDGQDWANSVASVAIIVATISIIWTKFYDDANKD